MEPQCRCVLTSKTVAFEESPTPVPDHWHDRCQIHYHEAVLGEYEHIHEGDGSVRYMDCDPSDGSTPTPVATPLPDYPHMDYSLVLPEGEPTPVPEDRSRVDIEHVSNHEWVIVNEPIIYNDVVNLPWVRDGVTLGPEFSGLSRLFVMLSSHRRIAASISLQSWFADGLNDLEADAINAFSELARWDENTALYLVGSYWMVNGLTPDEVSAVWLAAKLSPLNITRAEDVVRLDWFDNGVSPLDREVIDQIDALIGHIEPGRLFDILEMEFLLQTDATDVSALRSFNEIARDHPAEIDEIFGFRMIRDGIDDSETPIIGALSSEIWRDPSDYEDLLRPSFTWVEDRWIEMPLSGAIRVSLVRSDFGYDGTMDRVERVKRSAEAIVDRPLPTGHVSVVFTPRMQHGLDYSYDGHQVSVRDVYDAEERDDAVGMLAGDVQRS